MMCQVILRTLQDLQIHFGCNIVHLLHRKRNLKNLQGYVLRIDYFEKETAGTKTTMRCSFGQQTMTMKATETCTCRLPQYATDANKGPIFTLIAVHTSQSILIFFALLCWCILTLPVLSVVLYHPLPGLDQYDDVDVRSVCYHALEQRVVLLGGWCRNVVGNHHAS